MDNPKVLRFDFDFSLHADADTNFATDANEDNGADHPTNRQWIILQISFLTISADAAAFVNVDEDTSPQQGGGPFQIERSLKKFERLSYQSSLLNVVFELGWIIEQNFQNLPEKRSDLFEGQTSSTANLLVMKIIKSFVSHTP